MEGFEEFMLASEWTSYQRDEATLGWVTSAYGDGLTGYDMCEHVKNWLRQTSNDSYSLCEVLLRQGSPHVKRGPDCFASHVQLLPIGRFLDTLVEAPTHFPLSMPMVPFYWIDYACLRQCQADFKLPLIRDLVNRVGVTLVELDERHESI